MSLEDFDLWENIDPKTASPVTREHVYLDTTLPNLPIVRWKHGTIFMGRAIEHDVKDFDAWCKENLPYKWQGLYAQAHPWRVYSLDGADVVAEHFEGEKILDAREIGSRLAQLEQARYHIATLESAMLEAGLELENPWDVIREDIANGVGGG